MPIIKPQIKGFSLLELSVVLLILGILIYMTLGVTTAQLEKVKIQATQDKLTKIQNALTIFYQINNRLPCPADGEAALTAATFGKEQPSATVTDGIYNNVTCSPSSTGLISDATPTVYIGVVPTRSLGLSDETMMDGWGDRITYVVSKNCIDPDNWNTVNIYKCTDSTGLATANGAKITMNGVAQVWPTPAAFIVISHGKDRYGAYPRGGGSGSQILGPSTITYYPAEKFNGNLSPTGAAVLTGYNSYYDLPINDGDIATSYFDDLTLWNTPGEVDYNANH